MKFFYALTVAAAVSAAPIKANVKVVHVMEDGEKDVKVYENMEIGDNWGSAIKAISEKAGFNPHNVDPKAVGPEGELEQKIKTPHKSPRPTRLGKPKCSGAKKHGKDHEDWISSIEHFYKHTYSKIASSFGLTEEHSEKKSHHRSKEGTTIQEESVVAASYEGGKTAAPASDDSISLKDWTSNLYQGVSGIDYKDFFNKLASDVYAVCFIAGNFIGLVFAIAIKNRSQRIKLEEDEESQSTSNEKQ